MNISIILLIEFKEKKALKIMVEYCIIFLEEKYLKIQHDNINNADKIESSNNI
jgi:hypothetical protein